MLTASHCLAAVVAASLVAAGGFAALEEPSGSEKSPEKSSGKPADEAAVHVVEAGPFELEVELSGVFEARDTAEVSLRPEAWTQLEVEEAVGHGERVKEGDVLVRLDLEKIDEAIRELERDLELSGLSLRQSEEELELLERSLDLDLAAAKRSMERADEDLLRFLKVERPLSEKSAEQRVTSAKNYLEYEEEELRQLRKMYEADDLTEETEEIILKRQKDTVDRYRFLLENARIGRDETLEIDLPRRETSLEEAARRRELEWGKAEETLPLAVKKKKLELEKTRKARKDSEEQLAKLRKDRESMTIRSPREGLVYYGRFLRGEWQGFSQAEGKLRSGGTLQPGEAFLTVVAPRPLFARVVVPEKKLHLVDVDAAGWAEPTAFPGLRLPARVEDVARVPLGGEGHDARIAVELDENASDVLPGMTCSIELTPYSKEDAIAVPRKAVFQEDGRDHVYLERGDGHEKRRVKTGRRDDERVEILEGLEPGDRVLLKKPEEASS